MKKKIIGIFVCMLLIGTFLTASGKTVDISDNEKIVFEKRMNGEKHTVFMSGKCFVIGGNESSFNGLFRINLHWIDYSFDCHPLLRTILPSSIYESIRGNIIIVDGEIYILNKTNVILENFTGWAPGISCILKSFIPFARIRVFGVCDRIIILPQGLPPS